MNRLTILSLTLAFAFTGTAAAGDGKSKTKFRQIAAESLFASLDKDADGKLTLDEFMSIGTSAKPKKLDAAFKSMDKDSDGKLSKEEFAHRKKGERKNKKAN